MQDTMIDVGYRKLLRSKINPLILFDCLRSKNVELNSDGWKDLRYVRTVLRQKRHVLDGDVNNCLTQSAFSGSDWWIVSDAVKRPNDGCEQRNMFVIVSFSHTEVH